MKFESKSIVLILLIILFLFIFYNLTKQKNSIFLDRISITGRAIIGPNLIINGEFESGTSPWDDLTNSQIVTSQYHSGTRSVMISAGNPVISQWIRVTPGRTYVLIGWVKWVQMSDNDWGFSTFSVSNSNYQTIAEITFIERKYEQNRWQKMALTFTATTSDVMVSFGVYGPETTVEMYFDDLALYEKVGNDPPTINPQASLTSGNAPLTVTFTANGDDPDGAIKYYDWNFGDGTNSRSENPSHTFYQRGTYNVNLTVWDDDNAKTSRILTITVYDTISPEIIITSPTVLENYSTNSLSINIGGVATSSVPINQIYVDNIDSNEAKSLTINPSTNINWSTNIRLKPGKNEILVTAIDVRNKISTDKIIINRNVNGPFASNITILLNQVRVYEKFEFTFNLDTVAEYPFFQYDENPPPGIKPKVGVTVEGVFQTPSGRILRQPGFQFVEVVRTVSEGSVKYEETSNRKWAVRFSPQEVGTYQVSLNVRDASGSLNIPVGSFQALPPTKKGFIKVSQSDPRYFEFSNGDLYWPIGPANGNDYTIYRNTGQNLERPWMGGIGAYSTNWASWISSAERHGNEGYVAKLNFENHYPSHELSYEIFYPEGFRIWITPWSDGEFSTTLKPNTEYQVKFRFKTVNITGPRNPAYPFGLVIRIHGFLSTDTSISEVENYLRNRPRVIDHINTTQDWHTIVTTFRTPNSPTYEINDISIYLDNVNSGQAFIDLLSIREILPNGELGGEQIPTSLADQHTYVEQRPAAFIDWQVQQGEENGVFFKYVVHDKNDWIPNHLVKPGIFTKTGDGYYQEENTKARWLLKQWYRYLIARWGYSTAIHSWELNNEGPPDSQDHYRAAEEFARFMHNNDVHPHLATTSFWCCWKPQFWGNQNYSNIDYADIHKYTNNERFPDGTFMGYDEARFQSEDSMTFAADNVGKPIIRGETGFFFPGTTQFNYLTRPNPGIWYHNLLWAQLNPGGMSDPNYWWSEHFNALTTTRGEISRPFYQFVSTLDLNRGGYVDITALSSNPNLRILGQKNLNRNKAHFWVQNKFHTWRNVMGVDDPQPINPESGLLMIRINPNTDYTVEWWNTYTGAITRTETLRSDNNGNIYLTINNLLDDLAVKIYSSQTLPSTTSTTSTIITTTSTTSTTVLTTLPTTTTIIGQPPSYLTANYEIPSSNIQSGSVIAYKSYAEDVLGYWNLTPTQTFTVSSASITSTTTSITILSTVQLTTTSETPGPKGPPESKTTVPPKNKFQYKWLRVNSETLNTLKITDTTEDIEEISVNLSKKIDNVKINIQKLDKGPEYIKLKPGKFIYRYFIIDKGNLSNIDIVESKIRFKVSKTWIDSNNILESSIVLSKYVDNLWIPLSTTPISKDKDYVYYESDTMGFSLFAIVGDFIAQTPIQEQTTTTISTDIYQQPQRNVLLILLLIGLILFITGSLLIILIKSTNFRNKIDENIISSLKITFVFIFTFIAISLIDENTGNIIKVFNTITGVISSEPDIISYTRAAEYVGKIKTVEGIIDKIISNKKAVYLEFKESQESENVFLVIIKREYWNNFNGIPDKLYKENQKIRVTGKIEWYQGNLVIYVEEPSQIKIVSDRGLR